MICYADMTFCRWYHSCVRHSLDIPCPRALTETVKITADRVGLPICQFIDKPECFSPNGESAENLVKTE